MYVCLDTNGKHETYRVLKNKPQKESKKIWSKQGNIQIWFVKN